MGWPWRTTSVAWCAARGLLSGTILSYGCSKSVVQDVPIDSELGDSGSGDGQTDSLVGGDSSVDDGESDSAVDAVPGNRLVEGTLPHVGGGEDTSEEEAQYRESTVLFQQVDTSQGNSSSCGLSLEGEIVCWGRMGSGLDETPEGAFVQLSVGSSHACAISVDESMECWGGRSELVITDRLFSQVSAADLFTCGLDASGEIACVGDNLYGQIDHPEGLFSSIGTGIEHGCGIRPDGSIKCWGSDGGWVDLDAPDGVYSQVDGGNAHTCALNALSDVICWGADTDGISSPPPGDFIQLSTGVVFSCAVDRAGQIHCWGQDYFGETQPPPGEYLQVSAGGFHACAVRRDNKVVCWGHNYYGESSPP